MRISLPSSPAKHYLTGMDWVIHSLDKASKEYSGCGNSFLIAMMLNGEFNAPDFQESFSRYCCFFPELEGRAARDFNLAPYWQLRKKSKPSKFQFLVSEASSAEAAFTVLQNELNRPFEAQQLPVRAVLVRAKSSRVLGFIFDHRLFDARGAELFLDSFQSWHLSGEKDRVGGAPPGPAYLDRWASQFNAGKKINRAHIARKKSQLRFLENPRDTKGMNRFKVLTFTEKKKEEILFASEKKAGPFMFLPYSLACAVRGVDGLFRQKGRDSGDFVISVTRDMRAGRESRLLFNQLSFLFFQISSGDIPDFNRLLNVLKIQMYEQIKNRMPEALEDASMLMRILPCSVLSRRIQGKEGVPAVSFSFAVLGDSAYVHESFMQAAIENIVHLPRMSHLPGIGVFYSQYRNRLNVTLSYLDNLFSETEAKQLLEQVTHYE